MAARKRSGTASSPMSEQWRNKIRTSMLINRLQDNASGSKKAQKLDSIQQKSIEILLKKVLPDLAAVQHSGDAANPIVTETIIRPQLTREEWLKTHKS